MNNNRNTLFSNVLVHQSIMIIHLQVNGLEYRIIHL
jgi:hypothetical protein